MHGGCRSRAAAAALALAALVALPATADEVRLHPVRDNTLYEHPQGELSNGIGDHLFVGLTGSQAKRRALVAFDVAGAVPAGSTIDGVSLSAHVSLTTAGPAAVTLFRVTRDWGEGSSDAEGNEGGGGPAAAGDATWIHAFFPDVRWREPGGDVKLVPRAATLVGGSGAYVWGPTAAMTADVQSWLDRPDLNFGWMLVGDEDAPTNTSKRLDSRENPVPEQRPVLTIKFTPPADGETRARIASIGAAKDTTLYEEPFGSFGNGSGQHLFAGRTGGGAIRRALVAFDVEQALPAGSHVLGVNLVLRMSMTAAGPQNVALYRVTRDWGEGDSDAMGNEGGGAPAARGDATWIHTFFNTVFWSAPGGDFKARPRAAATVDGPGAYLWGSTPGLVQDVQQWLDDPSSNSGWILVGGEQAQGTAKRFDSRENPDPDARPLLLIKYVPPAGVRQRLERSRRPEQREPGVALGRQGR